MSLSSIGNDLGRIAAQQPLPRHAPPPEPSVADADRLASPPASLLPTAGISSSGPQGGDSVALLITAHRGVAMTGAPDVQPAASAAAVADLTRTTARLIAADPAMAMYASGRQVADSVLALLR